MLEAARGERFSLIVSNPPYIDEADRPKLMPEVRDFEPALALYGEGQHALGHHARLLQGAAERLLPGGALLLEFGADQADAVAALPAPGLRAPDVVTDLEGHPRIAIWSLL